MYEAALKRNPRDTTLASKIGQALVKTHNYGKVVLVENVALVVIDFLTLQETNLFCKLVTFCGLISDRTVSIIALGQIR